MTPEGSLDQRFADAMGQLLGPDFPSDIALAVSGGGDSMAMLTLAHNWARLWGVTLWVVTVDHGLRAESAAEAAMVAEDCAALGHPHCILKWHWDGQGNVQARARDARLALIDRWRGCLEHVLMAHTRDDVAETFLTRLSRQAGVEGLAKMKASRQVEIPGAAAPLAEHEFDGALPHQTVPFKGTRARPGRFRLLRPCLDMSRAELRHYLKTLQGRWVEDPSNDDPRFDRVRMRKLMPVLAETGLGSDQLAATARRMARAAEALRARAAQVWDEIGQEDRATGSIHFDRDGFAAVERDTQMRLLSYALSYVSSQTYRPREAPLEALLDRVLAGGGGTLHGCEVRMERLQLRVFREYAAVAGIEGTVGVEADWDRRWRIFHPECNGLLIRALGAEGWAQVEKTPDTAPPFHIARALPSVWEGETLVACDALNHGKPQTTRLWPMGKEGLTFKAFVLSH